MSTSANTEARETIAALVAEAEGLEEAAGGSVTEAVARWLAPQYAIAAREKLAGLSGDERIAFLREFTRDIALLRKGDHSAARIRLEHERLELARGLTESQIVEKFEEWLEKPKIKRVLLQKLSPEERAKRLREIFGVGEKPQPGLSPEALSEIETALKLL